MHVVSFKNEWDLNVKDIEAKLRLLCGSSTAELAKLIVNRTPVKTGALSSNWNVTAGSENLEFNSDKTSKTDTYNQANYIVHNFDLNNKAYIANGADYSEFIEYGASSQAPAGMTRVSCLSWRQIVDQFFRKIFGYR